MRLLRDYGLTVVLAILFFGSWILHGLTGWVEFAAEANQHNATPVLFGPDGYVWNFLASTFENWQSEFLQLFTMVVLTAFLIHRGSQQSKDSDEEMKLMIQRIERRVMELEPKETRRDR